MISRLSILSIAFIFLLSPFVVEAEVWYDTHSTGTFLPSVSFTSDDGDGILDSATTEVYNLHIPFNASTNYPINRITIGNLNHTTNINATTTGCNVSLVNCDDTVWLYVWNTSTSTFATDKTYVASGAMTLDMTVPDQDLVFDFDGMFYLVEGESYVFELIHGAISYDPWLFSNGASWLLNVASSTASTDAPNGYTYRYNANTDTYGALTKWSAGIKLELTGLSDGGPAIEINSPCVTSSWSYACTYGLASTTDVVTITGTSTLDMSINDISYMLVAKWISANGNVFDEALTIVYTTDNPVRFTMSVSRTYLEEVSALSEIKVCQYFDDLSLMSGYTTLISDPTRCASIIIGADISTASTTALAGDLGWLDPETNLNAGWDGNVVPTPSENEETSFVDFGILYETIKTFGVFAFWIPTMQLLELTYADYVLNGTSSTSTDTTFDIPLNMVAFGLPATDAHLPISAMFQKADDLSPNFFIYIDYFLWGLFWLFILSRILSGGWNILPSRGENGMSDKEYNERKYRHLVSASEDRDSAIRRGGRNKGYKW